MTDGHDPPVPDGPDGDDDPATQAFGRRDDAAAERTAGERTAAADAALEADRDEAAAAHAVIGPQRDGVGVRGPAEQADPDADGAGEVRAIVCFSVAVLAAVGLAVVYWRGGQVQLEGIFLALATGGIGAGIVTWAKAYLSPGEITEERGTVASTDEELAEFAADLGTAGGGLRQRRLLLGTGGAALVAFGAALLFPIRSLGPRPGQGLKETGYGEGTPGDRVRLVRVVPRPPVDVEEDGDELEVEPDVVEPVRPEDLSVDGVLTVFPEGDTRAGDGPTLLIRTRSDRAFDPRDGREGWTVDGIVAYSKLCTHTGCPVGLYQAEEGLLLCPCHQSTFDVYDGARPVFGPAARSLPQLPLGVDDEGYLVAEGDFSDPVGPGFWDRGR